jgi:hypothetical protein
MTKKENSPVAKVLAVLGATNLVSNVALSAVTTGLAAEAGESLRYAVTSRKLP